jgi:glycosyltransferase involved in cell wall biosynthesis
MDGVRFANDMIGGSFGERNAWQIITDALNIEVQDCSSLGVELRDWDGLKDQCWRLPRPRLGIQNATWAKHFTAGDAPYVAILQDNIRRMYADPVPQHQTLECARVIVCNGTLIAQDYAEYATERRRMVTIPLGIDVEFWTHADGMAESIQIKIERNIVYGDRKRAVFVGDGSDHKGWRFVRDLAAARRDLDWSFVCKQVGEGARALGDVVFLATRDQVRAELRRSDVFVLGSPVETQCLAALEAMACGLPVVMPATGCFHDWRPPSFFEAHPQDCKLFGDALDRALASRHDLDPRRDLLAAGRFTVEDMVSSWRALLTEVLANLA